MPNTVLDRSFGYGAALHILMKDIDLAIAQGEELGVPMWVCQATRCSRARRTVAGLDLALRLRAHQHWGGATCRRKAVPASLHAARLSNLGGPGVMLIAAKVRSASSPLVGLS
jgi:hypothetical protein